MNKLLSCRFTLTIAVLLMFGSAGFAQIQRADPSIPQDVLKDFRIIFEQVKKDPNNVPLLNSLGILYARAGQLSEAIELWKRGLSLDPKYIHLYNNLGSAYKSQRRFDEARAVFSRGLTLNPSYWIYYNLGLLEKDLGRKVEARKHFQACLAMNPNFEPAVNQLYEMERSVLASVRPSAGRALTPLPIETKRPIDYYEAFNMPAPWDLQDAPPDQPAEEPDRETHPEPHRIVPEKTLSVEDLVAFISKIPATPAEKVVALTFDDGPHAELTPRLLDFLRSERIVGTFFVLGSRAEVYPDILSRMVAEGNEVGNHTWKHKSLVRQDSESGLRDLNQTSHLITGLTGRSCNLVRPPYGHTNSRVLKMLHAQGWRQIMWDVDTRDWQGGSANAILSRVLSQFSPGSVILYHDIHTGALRTLPMLVTALKRCGYRFLTVSQLIGLVNVAG